MKHDNQKIENHPDEIQLAAYSKSPKSEALCSVQTHLITCVRCRGEVADYQVFREAFRHISFDSEKPEGAHLGKDILEDYVEKRLSSKQDSDIQQHLEACAYCTKAVLNYALSTTEKSEEVGEHRKAPSPPKREERDPKVSLWNKLKALMPKPMPVWVGVPATALAAIVLLLMINSGEKATLRIVTEGNNQEVMFSFTPPGSAFMNAPIIDRKPFQGIHIEAKDERHLHLKWSKIETAKSYKVKLYLSKGSDCTLKDSGCTLIGEASTDDMTEVSVQVLTLLPDQHYEWKLSGPTRDGSTFLAKGGFRVIQAK